ncbi:MAG: nicotinate phosphoribosyltransferase [Acidobacteria bacterium]|nr:MAG: nicotinate phosphoribosyltransferase [Acidobacteriota bacterium]RPJ75510.1 MAG: nicotinate phosphoribosyltransferase [Acidobacteriota bacterium]
MPTALSTDLYQLTMMAGYYAAGIHDHASFELYVRDLPRHRSYLVAAGLEQALDFLETLAFTQGEIEYLRKLPILSQVPRAFFDDYLPSFRFTGEVCAPPEGTPLFEHQPLLRVTAPILEAQLVETALLAIVGFQTSIASKAARIVEVSAGRPVIEFGGRRAHGTEAAALAARAAYLGGCAGTSNTEAGLRFGIPVSGTMAHSWVMTFEDELEAFRVFARLYGDRSVFLIDTYDTVAAARRVAGSELRPSAVRLDSGNIVELSRKVREILDAGGRHDTGIFVSGDLDEHKIAAFLSQRAPLNGFGVGTALSTSRDAPALGAIYKLVEVHRHGERVPTMKLSPGKLSYPGRKQAWRIFERTGGEDLEYGQRACAVRDVLALADEPGPSGGVPLLDQVMADGKRTGERPALSDLRERCLREVAQLPADVRGLGENARYPVVVSRRLQALADSLTESLDGA